MIFKVGDIVVAIASDDVYSCTNIECEWVGRIIEMYDDYFVAKTLTSNTDRIYKGETFDELYLGDFITINEAAKGGFKVCNLKEEI